MLRVRIGRLVRYTMVISVGTLIACIVWYGIALHDQGEQLLSAKIPYMVLPEILTLGIVCGAGTELICGWDAKPAEAKIRQIVHFIFINIVVLGFGYLFGWCEASVGGVLFMCLTCAAVYAFTYGLTYLNDVKTADRINRKLQADQSETEANAADGNSGKPSDII